MAPRTHADYRHIQVVTEGEVVTVTLNRPHALNAITAEMLEDLQQVLGDVHADSTATVVVLTGAGRAFSAGVDLKALAERGEDTEATWAQLNGLARGVIDAIVDLDAIVIAKVNGYCLTGALELALACDLIVAAQEALLGDTHAKWGLRPTWGLSQRLPARVGSAAARRMSYTAELINGAQAADWGLAAFCCPLAELDTTVAGLTASITAQSRGSLLAYKDLYRVAESRPLPEGLQYEASAAYVIPDAAQRVAGFR